MSKKIDLTGELFGHLVVICENGRDKSSNVLWLCRCDCGAEVTVRGSYLRDGVTRSCGCYKRERTVECHTTQYENGKVSRQYAKIHMMYSHSHKIHPELIEKANDTILVMRQCIEMLKLLKDVRAFKSQYLTP